MISAAGLANPGCAGTGGESVTRLGTVRAEACDRLATALVHGKRAFVAPDTIQIHGDNLVCARGRLVGRRARRGGWTGKGKAGRGLRIGVGAREGCGRLILLHRDGCRKVGVKGSRDRAPSIDLKTNVFFEFFRKDVDERMVESTGALTRFEGDTPPKEVLKFVEEAPEVIGRGKDENGGIQ